MLHVSILEIHNAHWHLNGVDTSSVPLVISKVKSKVLDWFLKLAPFYQINVICLGGRLITTVLSIYHPSPLLGLLSPFPFFQKHPFPAFLPTLYTSVTPHLKIHIPTIVPQWTFSLLWISSELHLCQAVSYHCNYIHVALGFSSRCALYAVHKLYFFSMSMGAHYWPMNYKGLLEKSTSWYISWLVCQCLTWVSHKTS